MTNKPMDFTNEQIKKLAKMGQLDLQESEIATFKEDLEGILSYVSTISEVDTTGVEPTFHVIDAEHVTYDDVPSTDPFTDDIAAKALSTSQQPIEMKQIKVPNVL